MLQLGFSMATLHFPESIFWRLAPARDIVAARKLSILIKDVRLCSFVSCRFKLHPDLQLEIIAELCPSNLTGADFYALCSDAILQSVKRKIEELEQGKNHFHSKACVVKIISDVSLKPPDLLQTQGARLFCSFF